MSVSEPHNLLMDYIYDEMSSSEREAFELELKTNAALREQLESLQETRALFKGVGESPAPMPMMYDLVREARKAVDEQHSPTLLERLNRWIMSPAMGVAALVVVVASTGVFMTREHSDEMQSSPMKQDAAPEAFSSKMNSQIEPVSPAAPEDGVVEEEMAEAPEEADDFAPAEKDVKRAFGRSSTDERTELAVADNRVSGGLGATKKKSRTATKLLHAKKRTRKKKESKQISSKSTGVAGLGNDRSTGVQFARSKSRAAKPKAKRSKLVRQYRQAEAQVKAEKRNLNVMNTAQPAPAPPMAQAKRGQAVVAKVAERSVSPTSRSTERQKGDVVTAEKKVLADVLPSVDSDAIAGTGLAKSTGVKGSGRGRASSEPAAGDVASVGDYEQAQAHLKNQRFNQAIRAFQRAAKRDARRSADAKRGIAVAHKGARNLRKAVVQYQNLLKAHPRYRHRAAVLVEAAQVEMKVGDLAAARKHLVEVVSSKNKTYAKRAKRLLVLLDKRIARKRAKARNKKATAAKPQKNAKAKSAKTAPTKSQPLPAKQAPARQE